MVEDTEVMRKWRGLSRSEIDQCWRNLAGRMEEELMENYKVEESKREAFRGKVLFGMEGAQKQEIQNKKVGRRLLGHIFPCLKNTNCSVCNVSSRSHGKKKR